MKKEDRMEKILDLVEQSLRFGDLLFLSGSNQIQVNVKLVEILCFSDIIML